MSSLSHVIEPHQRILAISDILDQPMPHDNGILYKVNRRDYYDKSDPVMRKLVVKAFAKRPDSCLVDMINLEDMDVLLKYIGVKCGGLACLRIPHTKMALKRMLGNGIMYKDVSKIWFSIRGNIHPKHVKYGKIGYISEIIPKDGTVDVHTVYRYDAMEWGLKRVTKLECCPRYLWVCHILEIYNPESDIANRTALVQECVKKKADTNETVSILNRYYGDVS